MVFRYDRRTVVAVGIALWFLVLESTLVQSSSDDAIMSTGSGALPISGAWGPSSAFQLPHDIPILLRSGSLASDSNTRNRGHLLLPLRSKESARRIYLSEGSEPLHLYLDMPSPELAESFYLSVDGLSDLADPDKGIMISVNGIPIQPLGRDAQKLELPLVALVEGRNEISVRLKQASDIGCRRQLASPHLYFVDLDRSGIEVSQNWKPPSLSWFKAALSAQIASGTGVPLRGAEMMTADQQKALAIRLSGTDNGSGNWLRFETRYGPRVSPSRDFMRISVGVGSKASAALHVAADGTIVLALVIERGGLFAAALETFFPPPVPVTDVPSLVAGKATPFQALALVRTPDDGGASRYSLSFRIADTWLVLADQKANLVLRYGSLSTHLEGVQVLLEVNRIALDPLPFLMSKTPTEHAISFPARYLRPGVNTLTLEATVPNAPSEMACFDGGYAGQMMFGQSTLKLPVSPLMQVPGMLPALLGLTQSSILVADWTRAMQDGQLRVVILALLAQMRPLAGQMPDNSVSLTVVSLHDVDHINFGDGGLTSVDLKRILNGPLISQSTTKRMDDGVFAEWITSAFLQVDAIARPGDRDFQEWSKVKTGDAVLIMPSIRDPGSLWLVLGPKADPIRVAAAVAQARVSPNGPRGQLAILSADGTWLDWRPAANLPELFEPLTLWNFRAVVGNFAAASPLYYVATLFGSLLLLVLCAATLVMSTRRRDRP